MSDNPESEIVVADAAPSSFTYDQFRALSTTPTPAAPPTPVDVPVSPKSFSYEEFQKLKPPSTIESAPSGELVPTTDIIPNVASGAAQAVTDPLRAGGAIVNAGAQAAGYQAPFDTNESTIRSYLPGMMRAKPADEVSQLANAAGYGGMSSALMALPLRGIGMFPGMGIARALGQGPLSQTLAGAVGGAAGQYAENRAKDAGLSEAAQTLANVGGNLLGGGLTTGLGLTTTPMMIASGHYVRDTQRLMRSVSNENVANGVAGQQLNRAFGDLGNWAESNANVGEVIQGQRLALDINKAHQVASAEDVARQTLKDMGGFGETSQYGDETAKLISKAFSPAATDADKKVAEQTLQVQQQLGNIRPTMTMEELGQEIRSRSNPVRQRPTGVMGDVLAKDEKGAFEVQNSDIPSMVFSNKLSEEDMKNMNRLSNDGFRRAFADAGAADFLNNVEKRGTNGERLGEIDPNKYSQWMKKFTPLMDNYERVTGDQNLRSRFMSVMNAQQLLDDLKFQRANLDKVYAIRPGSTDADIANKFIKAGDNGGAAVNEYLAATSGSPEAIGNFSDLVASKVRQAAVDKNTGLLDTTAFQKWAEQHKSMIGALPQEVRDNFMNAANAQRMLDTQSTMRSQAIRDYETSAASLYLGGQTPTQAVSGILAEKTGNPTLKMRDLVGKLSSDPDALNGLRRDFMEYAVSKSEPDVKNSIDFLKNLKGFLNQNEGVVKELYDSKTVDGLMKIIDVPPGAGLKEGAKWKDYLKASTTPIGALLLADMGLESVTTLSQMLPFAGAGLAAAAGAGVGGGLMVHAFRNAGMEKVNQIIIDAVRHPDLMRELTSTNAFKDKAGYTWQQRIASRLAVLGTEDALSQNREKQPIYPPTQRAKFPTIPGVVP